MKPTLQTVADAVGVSRSTVSNAYSRPDQLSAELRERIFEAARKLGYAGPNPVARTLRRGRVGAIGVLFTDMMAQAFTDPYAVEFLRGLAQAAEQHGTNLVLIPLSHRDPDGSSAALRDAVVDGFCVHCVPDWPTLLAEARRRGLPVVAEFPPEDDPDVMTVGIDDREAAGMAAEHLLRLGHRRIAFIGFKLARRHPTGVVSLGDPAEAYFHLSRERLQGFHDACAQSGDGQPEIVLINAVANTRSEGAAAAAYALDRADRCTAIATYSDVLGLGVLDALAARGLRPGRDISVVGFDDIPEAAAAGLTTIRQPAAEKGAMSAELLLDPPKDPAGRRVLLPVQLIVRSSTGPVERN